MSKNGEKNIQKNMKNSKEKEEKTTLKIKALSVNQAWRGRKFKTPQYKDYEEITLYLLPNNIVVPRKRLKLNIFVGMSSVLADIDNIAKPFIDILQKKYGFNDKEIYKLIIEKEIVKKKEEYISFFFSIYKSE